MSKANGQTGGMIAAQNVRKNEPVSNKGKENGRMKKEKLASMLQCKDEKWFSGNVSAVR